MRAGAVRGGRGRGCRRGGYGRERHGGRNGWQDHAHTAGLGVGVVAACVGRVDAAGRAVGAQADGAVAIAAVVRLVGAARDALAGKGAVGRRTDDEVGSYQLDGIGAGVGAERGVFDNVQLALGILGTRVCAQRTRVGGRQVACCDGRLDNGTADGAGQVARIDLAGVGKIDPLASYAGLESGRAG